MEEKRTKFNLVFKDEYKDIYITLYTTEPKTEEDIISLIEYWAEVNSRNNVAYDPYDIMEDICDNNDGWECIILNLQNPVIITEW